jgi:5'-nucleotidase
MSAAIEGAIEGTPSIGFSLCDFGHMADMSHTEKFIKIITQQVLEKGLPKGVALNVNFPAKSAEPLKGIKICRQANAKWVEDFDQRMDPNGRRYFWMVGNFVNFDKGEDNDEWAIANNYVSVVPCQFDLTAHTAIDTLKKDWSALS